MFIYWIATNMKFLILLILKLDALHQKKMMAAAAKSLTHTLCQIVMNENNLNMF